MGNTAGMRIKVTTEELISIAGEVEQQIKSMRQQFNQADNIVTRSGSYWEGDGQKAYIRAYRVKQNKVETALRRFAENAADLKTIAGVYAAAEASAVEMANSLSEDVIV